MGRCLAGPMAARLQATEHGEGDAWLVLGHGFGTSQAVWDPIIQRYGEHRRILTYDLAYLGQCARGEPLHGHLATYADDLIALLEEQNVSEATFLGHSGSGMIGLLASVVEPTFFRDLILLNASPRYLDDVDYCGGLAEAELDATFAAIQSSYTDWIRAFAPAVTGLSHGPALSQFAEGLQALRPDAALAVLRSIYEADLRGLLGQVSRSVEILQSRNDIAVPVSVGAYMAERIPVSRLVVLDLQGHLPHLTTPERLWPCLDAALLSRAA